MQTSSRKPSRVSRSTSIRLSVAFCSTASSASSLWSGTRSSRRVTAIMQGRLYAMCMAASIYFDFSVSARPCCFLLKARY